MRKPSESYLKLKKATDKILSGAGLVVLSPVFAGIAIAIKLEDGITAPVFFKQKRVGIHKSHFMLYKFRSMQTDTPHDTPTHLLSDPEQYLTGTGRWLRKTSLDELPQLLNIFQGDMAVVGPRPALWNQYDLLEERDKYGANDIRPGLTGWAQIHGRDELEISEKARLDGYYVRHVHGGEVIFPFIGGLYGPDLGWFPGRMEGIYSSEDGTRSLILSRGLGTNEKIPRFHNIPEIVVADIQGKG